jgi:hypothetical protein
MNTSFFIVLMLDVALYLFYFVVVGLSFTDIEYARETPLFRSHIVTTLTLIRCTWLFRDEDLPWNMSALLFGLIFDVINTLIAALAAPQTNTTLWSMLLAVSASFCMTSSFGIFCMWITKASVPPTRKKTINS